MVVGYTRSVFNMNTGKQVGRDGEMVGYEAWRKHKSI